VRDARTRVATLNAKRIARGREPLGYGIGLHEGELTYGNIGTDERLEFTVIGDAANFAARIEDLTKTLGVSVIVSEAFAPPSGVSFKPLGKHALRGLSGEHELFTLTDDGEKRHCGHCGHFGRAGDAGRAASERTDRGDSGAGVLF